jgi:superfamily II DNA helicase RecQ
MQGTDLKNVTLVVQFMVPDTLSVWVQRAGRAGRSGAPSAAVLLYEPSVTQRVKGKADESGDEVDGDPGEQSGEGGDFRKRNVEVSLRSYVLTDQCRRVVTDGYFGTPARNKEGMVNFELKVNTLVVHSTDDEIPRIFSSML